jgi:3',5'-cyclic AMP phosphodiesterase CpdA
MRPYIIAHFSDLHICDIKNIRFKDLLNKRLYGYLSYKIHRGKKFNSTILHYLAEDLTNLSPDHIVITGDLTHLSLRADYDSILKLLTSLGDSSKITIIPGNHDFYIPGMGNIALNLWRNYMISDNTLTKEVTFPFLRIRDDIALIGVNTSHTTPPFFAYGHLGSEQLTALNNILSKLDDNLFTVLLIHHPPLKGVVSPRKELKDIKEFYGISYLHKIKLMLHGHSHYLSFNKLKTNGMYIPVFGVPSILSIKNDKNKISSYNIYCIDQRNNHTEVIIQTRSFSLSDKKFEIAGKNTITIPL